MRRVAFGWIAAAVLLVAGVAGAAQLEARLERSNVVVGEPVELLLRLRDGREAPELDPLTRDFDVLDVSRTMRTSIVNDRVDASVDWSVTLAPRGTGEFEIPALRAGDAVSAPLALRVMERSAYSAGDHPAAARAPVFLETEVDDTEPYVQGRVILTARLHADESLIDGEIHAPEVEGAVVERVGEDQTYHREIGARSYQVVERQFAIFPQRSGQLQVSPVVFDGRVREARRARRSDPFGSFFGSSFFDDFSGGFGPRSSLFDEFFGGGGKPVRTASAGMTLDVQARPEAASGTWWLPARDVELIEEWEHANPVFRVGEPIQRTVAIRATGLSGAQLPELDLPDVEGMKQYGEPAVDDTVMRGDDVVSVKLQRTALIPTRPGSVTLPAIELAWWDTQEDTARTAILPERSVEVMPGDEDIAAAPPAVLPAVPTDAQRPAHDQSATNIPHPWRLGAWVGAGLGVLALLVMAVLPRVRRRWTPLQPAESGGRRGPPVDLRGAEAALKHACRSSDPAAAVAALRGIARARWPEANGLGAAEWAARLDAPELERAIEGAQRAAYAAETAGWEGAALWQIYRGVRRSGRRQNGGARTPPLPSLYPAR